MMFDSFTPPARAVVMGAQQQAKQLGHNYMGTEHVLFALLAAEEAAGGGVLSRRGVTLRAAQAEAATRSASWTTDAAALRAVGIDPAAITDQARQHLRTELAIHGQAEPPRPAGVPADAVAFTPRTKRVFELSVAAAGQNGVTPQHILIALLEEGAGLAPIVLEHLGVPLDELRAELTTQP